MSELINPQLVALDATYGGTKDDVIRALARLVADAGRSTNADGLAEDAFAREAKSVTGMPGGLAIPHCRSEHVTVPSLAFARLSPPVDFGAKDGPADLVFMIAAPASGDQEHMKLLTKLARAWCGRTSPTPFGRRPAPPKSSAWFPRSSPLRSRSAPAAAASRRGPGGRAGSRHSAEPPTIVAVTACPTGIAHTYMAAEALEAAGTKAGIKLLVEPQGSVGAERLDPKVIAAASAVIFATDVGVRDKGRFAGLPEISTSVKSGIHDADELVSRALAAADDPNAPRVAGDGGGSGSSGRGAVATGGGGGGGLGTQVRTALLTGVSYMIPFVAAGGLLIALGFLLGGYELALSDYGPDKDQGLADFVLGSSNLTQPASRLA